MSQGKRSLEDELYRTGCVFLIIGCIGMLLYFKLILPNFDVFPCVLYRMLGIYCPGCGGTRAVSALFHGQLLQSLWYHPLVLYTVVIFGGFMVTQTCERLHVPRMKGWKFHSWYLYGAVAVILLNFFLKNLLLLGFHIMM